MKVTPVKRRVGTSRGGNVIAKQGRILQRGHSKLKCGRGRVRSRKHGDPVAGIINGDFDTDLSGWTYEPLEWEWREYVWEDETIDGGARQPVTSTRGDLSQSFNSVLSGLLKVTLVEGAFRRHIRIDIITELAGVQTTYSINRDNGLSGPPWVFEQAVTMDKIIFRPTGATNRILKVEIV